MDIGVKFPLTRRELDKPSITVYERQGPNRWTDTKYTQASDFFFIDGQPIALKDVYLNLYF